jgi:hypothetical protein
MEFLDNYRENRPKALNNEERAKWSTEPLENIAELIDYTFDSTQENDDWESLYAERTANLLKLESVRLKVAFLAGCRRDLRILFGAGSGHRIRVPLDHDRFEYMRLNFHRLCTEGLKQVVDTKDEQGSASEQTSGEEESS